MKITSPNGKSILRLALIFCGFAAVLMPDFLQAEEISLDLGGGVKMDFVWIAVTESGAKLEIEIGDFEDPGGRETLRKDIIWGPFEHPGSGTGYYLSKTEVTESQWKAVMHEGNASELPIVSRSFYKIQEFVTLINKRAQGGDVKGLPEKADRTPGVLRLPTEAEWEYAARGGAGGNYSARHPYGEDRQIERFEVVATPGSAGKPQEVGKRQPNLLGLHDMLGNVREYVEGVNLGGASHMLRGGSFLSEPREIRASARTEQPPFDSHGKLSQRPDAGFRLCITAPEITRIGQIPTEIERAPDPEKTIQEMLDILNVAFTAQQVIRQKKENIHRLESVNFDGFATERLQRLRREESEQISKIESSIVKLIAMDKTHPDALSIAVTRREEQLKSAISMASEAIARNASEAFEQIKIRLDTQQPEK